LLGLGSCPTWSGMIASAELVPALVLIVEIKRGVVGKTGGSNEIGLRLMQVLVMGQNNVC
jgi:hypothetical protein